MLGGRTELILSVVGIAVVAAGILLGISRMSLARSRRGNRRGDSDEFLDAVDTDDSISDGGPPHYETFADALRDYVLPLHEAHPDWDRLDGAVGLPGRASFRFERDGIRFEVNGETRFAPLLAAHDWMAAHPGEDPLQVQRAGPVGRLRLKEEIWPERKDVKIKTN